MRKQYLILGVFLIIGLSIYLLRGIPPVSYMVSFVQTVFSGPKEVIYGVKTDLSGSESEDFKKLKEENDTLEKKLLGFQKIARDNEALRSQFETTETSGYKMVPAQVLGSLGRFNEPSELVIDIGEDNGVRRGMAVVSGVNLVGKVNRVSKTYSKVALLTNESFTEVARGAENGALGLVAGQRDFILLSQVSIKDKISNGETILTRGVGENIESLVPAGLVIGKISSLFKNESMPYQTAKIENELNIEKLETVFVITGF